MLNRALILLFIILNLNIYGSNITPIPEKIDFDLEKALLGKKLFNDKRLSANNTISCASCHDLKNGGDDNLVTSIGINNSIGNINAPTVLNAVFNFRQFWDGRAKDLDEQAMGPVENPIEMGHSFDVLVKELSNMKYKDIFLEIYEDGITKKNIANAIAEFEKTLITPNSKFDKFLKGDKLAISKFENEGYELFKNKGCITCHHGVNVGGNLYNKFGVIFDPINDNLGRYNLTKDEEDKYFFKVPGLRNIEFTAPYFHDGRYYDLERTVKEMALVQLGRPMTEREIRKIVAFLKTLSGELTIIE